MKQDAKKINFLGRTSQNVILTTGNLKNFIL